MLARKAIEAQDLPVDVRHPDCWRTVLTLGDKPVRRKRETALAS
ncbi:MAG: hypothetical protein ACR2RB_04095 [Gammaproteobacteria bacterium]